MNEISKILCAVHKDKIAGMNAKEEIQTNENKAI